MDYVFCPAVMDWLKRVICSSEKNFQINEYSLKTALCEQWNLHLGFGVELHQLIFVLRKKQWDFILDALLGFRPARLWHPR